MKKIQTIKRSLEIIADFVKCDFDLLKHQKLKKKIFYILKNNNVKVLKTAKYIFPNKGSTIIFLLSDSHLALHTWPEKGIVNFDLFLCNYKRKNEKRVKNIYNEIKRLLNPEKTVIKKLLRYT
ncbi:MAG: hypothetical protein C4278_02365 [Patescibacteria group bacterium]